MKLNIGDKFVWSDEGIIYTVMDINTSRDIGQVLVEWWSHDIYGIYGKKIMWDSTLQTLEGFLSDGTIYLIYQGNLLGPKGSVKKLKLI